MVFENVTKAVTFEMPFVVAIRTCTEFVSTVPPPRSEVNRMPCQSLVGRDPLKTNCWVMTMGEQTSTSPAEGVLVDDTEQLPGPPFVLHVG